MAGNDANSFRLRPSGFDSGLVHHQSVSSAQADRADRKQELAFFVFTGGREVMRLAGWMG
jgi:hypothetical protein